MWYRVRVLALEYQQGGRPSILISIFVYCLCPGRKEAAPFLQPEAVANYVAI